MKKFLLFVSLAAAVAFSTSCSDDEEEACPSMEALMAEMDGIPETDCAAQAKFLRDNKSCLAGQTDPDTGLELTEEAVEALALLTEIACQ